MLKLFKSLDECLVSSQSIKSEFFKIFIALSVISSKFPIGVETMYRPFSKSFIKLCKKIVIITYILLSFNFKTFADENQKSLKVGLLAPFSGEYKDIGQSIMLSLQLALDEIGDDQIKIFPRDSGFNNSEKLKEYAVKARPAVEKFSGKFLARGGKNRTNEGIDSPRVVVVEFPDYNAAVECYDSIEYQEAHDILRGYVVRHHQIVEGY